MLQILSRQSKPGSRAYSGERLVNYFARPSDGATPVVLKSRGGLVSFADLGSFPRVRAMAKMGGDMFAVTGGRVFKITAAGVVSTVGTVIDGETSMAATRSQVAIVAGGTYYVCDGTSTSVVSPGAITNPVSVAAADNYIVVIGTGNGNADTFQVSSETDATDFNALEFATAEYDPDALVGVIYDHKQLYLFGADTTEVWYNTGGADFPFAPNPSAIVEHGCANGQTIAKIDSAVMWVRQDWAVVQNYGGTPQVVSTPEIKEALRKSTVVRGFTFSEGGHEFYAIWRLGDTTLVYDVTTGLWHERASGVDYDPWGAACSLRFGDRHYFGTMNGQIAYSDDAIFTDFGGVMLGEFETPLVMQNARRFRVKRLHIDVDSSTGGLGRTPEAMLQMSKDGVTWGREFWRPMADLGEYGKRLAWHSLGQYRRGKARFRVTDPVKRDVIGGAVEYA